MLHKKVQRPTDVNILQCNDRKFVQRSEICATIGNLCNEQKLVQQAKISATSN